MKCMYCNHEETAVIDSRLSDDGASVRRRRQCETCSKRFTTYERVEKQMPMVVKQDKTREQYARAKIEEGFRRATHKRRVPADKIELAIDRIEHKIVALAVREVSSRVVGEMVMRELQKLDDVAYIRFASIYENFQRIDEFREKVLEVKRPGTRRTATTAVVAAPASEQEPQ